MRYAASIDQQGNRFVKLVARCLAIAAAWSMIAISAVIAGSPEEDFRAGLSAFNGGDFATAMRLWRPLADSNDARSQAGIGFLYHRGLGVKTDDVQAAFWLRKAAEQGQAEGQLMLGSLYFFGLGVPQSYAAAYAWCELAQDNGHAEAPICRDAALQSLTEDAQLREAFRMVRELRERLGHVSGQ
jgi:TPR repeat protein